MDHLETVKGLGQGAGEVEFFGEVLEGPQNIGKTRATCVKDARLRYQTVVYQHKGERCKMPSKNILSLPQTFLTLNIL